MNGSPSYDGWKLRSDMDDAPDPDEGLDKSGWWGSPAQKRFTAGLREAAREREAEERRAAAMDEEAEQIAESEGWR